MNIIYFNPDQLRADFLGCYGHPVVQTPNMDRLAEDGVRFDQCHVENPVCTPSRCCFMTGWYPHVRGHRSLWHTLADDEPNTLRYLRNSGYDVHWIGRNDMLTAESIQSSVTKIHSTGGGAGGIGRSLFTKDDPGYWSFLYGPEKGHASDWHRVQEGVRFLHSRKKDDPPLMLFLALGNPHVPFTCPQPWYDMYSPDDFEPVRPAELENMPDFHQLIRQYRNLDQLDEKYFRKLRAVYAGMITCVDETLGRILQALRETGQEENTAIFFFSDHGEWAGDYGLVEKWPNAMDDCMTRVPMIVRAPGAARGHVVHEPMECFDIMPTTLEVAGVECGHDHFARSMRSQLEGNAGDPDRAVYCEGGYDVQERQCMEMEPGRLHDVPNDGDNVYYPKGLQQQEQPESVCRSTMIRTQDHKLIFRPNGQSELYEYASDPNETVNLYNTPEPQTIQQQLETRLLNWYVSTSDVVPRQRSDRGFG